MCGLCAETKLIRYTKPAQPWSYCVAFLHDIQTQTYFLDVNNCWRHCYCNVEMGKSECHNHRLLILQRTQLGSDAVVSLPNSYETHYHFSRLGPPFFSFVPGSTERRRPVPRCRSRNAVGQQPPGVGLQLRRHGARVIRFRVQSNWVLDGRTCIWNRKFAVTVSLLQSLS